MTNKPNKPTKATKPTKPTKANRVPRRNAPARTLRLATAGSAKAAESAGTKYPGVASAIRAGDLASWHLADALAREVARGMRSAKAADYAAMVSDLMAAGVAGIPSVGMLRQARATSLHYDPTDRVDGVSFTAHRLAKSVGDGKAAAAFLRDLVTANGGNPAAVTVTVVQAAVRAQSANPVAGTTRATTKATKAAGTAAAVTPVAAPEADASALGALIRQARAVADQARALLADASDADLDALAKALARIGTAVDRETARRKADAAKATATKAAARPTKPGPKAKGKARPVVGMRG